MSGAVLAHAAASGWPGPSPRGDAADSGARAGAPAGAAARSPASSPGAARRRGRRGGRRSAIVDLPVEPVTGGQAARSATRDDAGAPDSGMPALFESSPRAVNAAGTAPAADPAPGRESGPVGSAVRPPMERGRGVRRGLPKLPD